MRGHRTPRLVRVQTNVNSGINVTPLVDVVLVLLIIFMVVTPLLEKDIPVRTPNSEKLEAQSEPPPDQLVVYVSERGELRINAEAVALTDLVSRLQPRLAAKPPSDRVVFLVPDDRLNYGAFVSVIDRTKQAGAEILGFATDAPTPDGLP
jgi:biopolymer transport protein TolR